MVEDGKGGMATVGVAERNAPEQLIQQLGCLRPNLATN